ncbi:MAG TPA: rhodanese-like domain-containing protein [Candidatus Baltobacteraceae bacterium]
MNDDGGVQRVHASDIDTTTTPVLDARRHPGKEQIRGALRYDERALLTEERLAIPLPHDRPIVVYADSDDDAERVAERLHEQGFLHAVVLEGGFEAYRQAGLPVEELTQEQPIPGAPGTGIPRG